MLLQSPLSRMAESWLAAQDASQKHKAPYYQVMQQCWEFFRARNGFMWDSEYRNRYMKGLSSTPPIETTVNKPFEFVSIVGPYLYWNAPKYKLRPTEPIRLDEMLAIDPQLAEAVGQEQSLLQMMSAIRCRLMEPYLNWVQESQPGSGHKEECRLGVTEMLVKGRGVLWQNLFSYPGSPETHAGLFYDSVDNLFLDPDCCHPQLVGCRYIMRRHVNFTWEVEERFGLPPGTVQGNHKGADSTARRKTNDRGLQVGEGSERELVTWYEIFSRMGAGKKYRENAAVPQLEELLGDNVYICVAKNNNFPLNAFPLHYAMANGLPAEESPTEDDVRRMFAWPTPFWRSGRWPCELLDAYEVPGSAWPLSPVASAIGELTLLNILASTYTSQVFSDSRRILAVVKESADKAKQALKSLELETVIEINAELNNSVNDMISYLQKPGVNADLPNAMAYLEGLIDKRLGTPAFLFGMNDGGVSRSAADIQAKQSNTATRPRYLADRTTAWVNRAVELMAFATYYHVTPSAVVPLLGQYGAMAWERYVSLTPPDEAMWGTRSNIEASDMRMPNEERKAANLQQLGQTLLPLLQEHSSRSGDTAQLNAFISQVADSLEVDATPFLIPPEVSNPEMASLQLSQEQADLEATLAEADKDRALADKAEAEAKAIGSGKLQRQAAAASQ